MIRFTPSTKLSILTLLTSTLAGFAADSDKPVVYVAVPPYVEIAQRIAGDHFEVRSVVSETDDPHGYSPTPKQIAQLSKASILFTGEMEFEPGLREALASGNRKVQIHSLTEGLDLLEGSCATCAAHGDQDVFVYVKGQDEPLGDVHHHHHEDDDEVFVYVKGQEKDDGHDDHHHHHDHDHGLDPHLWLSPKMLKAQAGMIAEVFKKSTGDEAVRKEFAANLETVLKQLDTLDTELAEKLAFMKGETFYVYHGAFAYFAKAYGLNQEAIEVGGRRPEPKQLTELIKKAKDEGVRLVFVQPQFDQSSAKTLANSIGGDVVKLDPLKQDVFENLRTIARTIGQSRL